MSEIRPSFNMETQGISHPDFTHSQEKIFKQQGNKKESEEAGSKEPLELAEGDLVNSRLVEKGMSDIFMALSNLKTKNSTAFSALYKGLSGKGMGFADLGQAEDSELLQNLVILTNSADSTADSKIVERIVKSVL